MLNCVAMSINNPCRIPAELEGGMGWPQARAPASPAAWWTPLPRPAGFQARPELLEVFSTEFQMRLLWGSQGASSSQARRYEKFDKVLTALSHKLEPAVRSSELWPTQTLPLCKLQAATGTEGHRAFPGAPQGHCDQPKNVLGSMWLFASGKKMSSTPSAVY